MPAIFQKRVFRWTIFSALFLLGFIALAEFAARVAWKEKDPLHFAKLPASAGDPANLEFDAAAGWTMRPNLPNREGFGTVFSTNNRGLRMDTPFIKKPRTRVRIAVYGDDIGFGAGIAGLPYPALLEDELKKTFPGADIDVVNLSVPGYSLLRIEGRIKDTIGWVQPDFVVVQSFARDVAVEGVRDSLLTNAGSFERALRHWSPSSRLASGLLDKLEAARANHPLDSCGLRRVCTEDYMWCAMRIRDFCRQNGANFHMLAPIWQVPPQDGATHEQRCLTEIHNRIRDLGRWHGFPMHESIEAKTAEEAKAAYLSGEFALLSDAGQTIIAHRLKDRMRHGVWNRVNELAEAYPSEMKALNY